MKKNQKDLKTGFTTGAAAAAASKAALIMYFYKEPPESVNITLLTGKQIKIPVLKCFFKEGKVQCSVIKDAGDDPDITHKAEIGCIVSFEEKFETQINILGGHGVGKVTKPGLEVLPGKAAINPGPVKMIKQSVNEILEQEHKKGRVTITIFVPKGLELAKKTLNSRLGIIDGISILGTTGLVRPLSHEAYVATIKSSLSVARAAKLTTIVLTTGRRSEKFAQNKWSKLPEEAFCQMGDYFAETLQNAVNKGFKEIILAVFFGKAVKMAQRVPNTHAAKSNLSVQFLSNIALNITKNKEVCKEISNAVTARHVFDIVINDHKEIIFEIGKKMIDSAKYFTNNKVKINGVIFDYQGNVIFY